MYSLERRRDRYKIIYAWQQFEGLKENIMKFKTKMNKTNRMINKMGTTLKAEMPKSFESFEKEKIIPFFPLKKRKISKESKEF